jgi:ferredoxin
MPSDKTLLLCSCERSQPCHAAAAALAAPGARIETADQLCRAGLDRFRRALADGGPVTVACGQEQALFEEVAEDAGFEGRLDFVNLRETGGWSDEAARAAPKTAALIAAAAVAAPPVALVSAESAGVALVLGRDEAAVEAARRLADHLDVTVLLTGEADVTPPARAAFPILRGRVRNAAGAIGDFTLTVDGYAAPDPSSRATLRFGATRDGATSKADLVLDMTGGRPLFPEGLRDGYLRADPRDRAAVERAVFEAAQLVGGFDRPRYISFDAGLCAHSRSRITGCTRCLDLCPAGAITPAGNSVAIDPMICAGCGQCASACPTGAASYALPPAETLVARLRAALRAYAAAGGADATILLHDESHGAPLIDALARFGNGLPARSIPLAVNEATQVGPEALAAALAYGAASVRVLVAARPRHDVEGLRRALALTAAAAGPMGYGDAAVGLIETDDPDALRAALDAAPAAPAARAASAFLPPATKRGLLVAAFEELGRLAPNPADAAPLPAGAPFGAAIVDRDACTLCMACVSACPSGALIDNPDAPMLRFDEKACVQCGLCERTCPEKAITLEPRLDLAAWAAGPRVVNEEPALCCADCGKAFATASAIAKVRAKLADHWMFAGEAGASRRRLLELCEDCRVRASLLDGLDPYGEGAPRARTTEDYLRERKT